MRYTIGSAPEDMPRMKHPHIYQLSIVREVLKNTRNMMTFDKKTAVRVRRYRKLVRYMDRVIAA